MVMSGSGERIVFVHARPGDESLMTGGTIARLRSDGARVVVLFAVGADESATEKSAAEARAALGELDVSDWRMLPAASDSDSDSDPDSDPDLDLDSDLDPDLDLADDNIGRELALHEVFEGLRVTAVVVGDVDDGLLGSATGVAHPMGVPVFVSQHVSGAAGARVTAIDVSDHVDAKLRALSAYPGRWSVGEHMVNLSDGTQIAVTGTETYLRLDPPRAVSNDAPRTRAGRVLASVVGLSVGAAFGMLGTMAHQATLVLGQVTIPVGLILALLGAGALLVGLRLVLGDRLVVLLCAIGLLGTIFLLSLRGTGGSVLVPAGLPGTLWTIVPALVAALVLAWPKLPARR